MIILKIYESTKWYFKIYPNSKGVTIRGNLSNPADKNHWLLERC